MIYDKPETITEDNLVFGDCTFELTLENGDKVIASGPMSYGSVEVEGNVMINGVEMSQKEAEEYLRSVGIGKAST